MTSAEAAIIASYRQVIECYDRIDRQLEQAQPDLRLVEQLMLQAADTLATIDPTSVDGDAAAGLAEQAAVLHQRHAAVMTRFQACRDQARGQAADQHRRQGALQAYGGQPATAAVRYLDKQQ